MPRQSAVQIWFWAWGEIPCVEDFTCRIVQKHVARFSVRERSQWRVENYMKTNFEMRRASRKSMVAAPGLALCANGCRYFAQQPKCIPINSRHRNPIVRGYPARANTRYPVQARPPSTR